MTPHKDYVLDPCPPTSLLPPLPALSNALQVCNPHAAGIDIGEAEHWVAVPPERDPQPVRPFRLLHRRPRRSRRLAHRLWRDHCRHGINRGLRAPYHGACDLSRRGNGSGRKPVGQRLTQQRKPKGDSSMSSKRSGPEAVYGPALPDPCVMVKAWSPEPQSPGMKPVIRRSPRPTRRYRDRVVQ
jgi:hypothetical protein